jgi:hypothetical protein
MTTKAILDSVYNEVLELHHHREIWRFFNEELPKHDGGIVHSALTRWYVDAQAAAVRRIAGVRSQDKRSMARLLKAIQRDLAENSGGSGQIDPKTIDQDLETLRTETAAITRWADESVAHMGRRRSIDPTFKQLDEAIDVLGRMLQKYYSIINAGAYLASVEPVIQEDWRRPFRSAWL